MRNGLFSASGTEFQVNGAAYGSGIYLSPSAQVSLGYSRMSLSGAAGDCEKKLKELDNSSQSQFIGNSPGCMAICEVVDHDIQKSGDIWVQPHEDHVITRFFIVFDESMYNIMTTLKKHHFTEFPPSGNLHTQSDAKFATQLRQVVNQFV